MCCHRNCARQARWVFCGNTIAGSREVRVTKFGRRRSRRKISDCRHAESNLSCEGQKHVICPIARNRCTIRSMCGRLPYSMRGTRDAAVDWADKCPQRHVQIGLQQGTAIPCLFYEWEQGLVACVYGGDLWWQGYLSNSTGRGQRRRRKTK